MYMYVYEALIDMFMDFANIIATVLYFFLFNKFLIEFNVRVFIVKYLKSVNLKVLKQFKIRIINYKIV